jgi:hypothetical protein
MRKMKIWTIHITLIICILFLTGCGDDEYNLHLTIDGKGAVSLDGTKYENSTTVTYEENKVVSVAYSNAFTDWEFVEYTGDLTGTSGATKLTMNSDKSFTAIFSLANSVAINGTVYDTNNVAIQGVTVSSGSGANQVTAITDSNGAYSMDNVPVPDNKIVYLSFVIDGFADQTYYFEKVKSEMTLEKITLLREYNLEIQNNFYNSGSTAPIPGIYTFTQNYVKTLSASHYNTLTFDKWSGDVPLSENVSSESISITMDMNRTIRAIFLQFTSYTIQVYWNENYGSVAQEPEGVSIVEGRNIHLSNTPADGYVFSHWIDNHGQLYDTPALDFYLSENVEYTCIFNQKTYQLIVEKSGEGSYRIEPVSDTMTYLKDTAVTLTAIPASGWLFRRWQNSISSSSTYQQVKFLMDSDKTITLVFEKPYARFMGQVTKDNHDGLEGVKVIAGSQSTLTDENGFFLLDKAYLPKNADTMIILFHKPGYCVHSAAYSVYDQIELNVFPQLSDTCNMLATIIQTLKILNGQISEDLYFDINANNQPDLSEVVYMLQCLAE